MTQLRVVTESGTAYETDGSVVTRLNAPHELRRDGEPLKILQYTQPEVGYPWTLLLAVRDDAVTLRRTSPVVEVVDGNAEHCKYRQPKE